MKRWFQRRRVVWPMLAAGILVALVWHAMRSATQARVVVYNEGPAAVAAVVVRWGASVAEWGEIEPEGNRQAWLVGGSANGAPEEGQGWVILSWSASEPGQMADRLGLARGERVVVRLRSDVGVVAVTRTRAWARRLADWTGEVLE